MVKLLHPMDNKGGRHIDRTGRISGAHAHCVLLSYPGWSQLPTKLCSKMD
jgi:hypothetical protein